ncbi:YraN family protein [Candidatus Nomurabacteria bacterium]|nr:YraN family protein [Candidatus Nomurabacteria bacterium]
MEQKKKNTKKVGDLGESIAVKYLKNKGFSIIDRNYRKKYGEIDIVARGTKHISKDGFSRETVHFVEVKSVSYETKEMLEMSVSHETYRPEEQVHSFKLNQIRKTADIWISENEWNGEVQIDVIAVHIVSREKYALVRYIEQVVID